MDVVGSVGDSWAELSVRNPPAEGVVVEEEDASELSRGVVVGPVDAGSRAGEENEGLERRVERGQRGEIGRVVGVFVLGMGGGTRGLRPCSLLPLPPHRHGKLKSSVFLDLESD